MKAQDFKAVVKANKDKDESIIAAELLKAGCSLSFITKHLNKELIDLGVRIDNRAALKAVKGSIKKEDLLALNTYRDLRIYSEKLSTKHKVDINLVLKVVRKQMSNPPSKMNLGIIKATVVTYFKGNDNPSMDGLAEALKEVADAEVAQRQAYQLYSFAFLLSNKWDLSNVN